MYYDKAKAPSSIIKIIMFAYCGIAFAVLHGVTNIIIPFINSFKNAIKLVRRSHFPNSYHKVRMT